MPDLSFSGNLILNDTKRFQFIYSSQNYGTLYGVYAKFVVEKQHVTNIQLYIINYKGPLNLGFINGLTLSIEEAQKAPNTSEFNNEIKDNCSGNDFNFVMPVRGMSPFNFTNIKLKTPMPINFRVQGSFHLKRILFPLNKFNMHSGKLKIEGPYKENAFDSEFYFRQGVEATERTRHEGLLDSEVTMNLISRDCVETNLKTYSI